MIENKINNLVSIDIFLLYNKMLSGHEKVKMFLEMKFQDPNEIQTMRLCDAKKMIVGRHYCFKGKGIYSGTCSM